MIAIFRTTYPVLDRQMTVGELKAEARADTWARIKRLGFLATGTPSAITLDHENSRLIIEAEVNTLGIEPQA